MIIINFSTGNFGQRAQDAAQRATEADMKATDAQNKINYILVKMPQDKEKVQKLATDTVNTNKDMNDAARQSKST